jgi:microcystin-dependent protein
VALLYQNFVSGLLSVAIDHNDTTLESAGLAALQVLSSPDFVKVVLDPEATGGEPEIVYVTAHSASSESATIVRGREGTTGRAHDDQVEWRLVLTSADAERWDQAVADLDTEEAARAAADATESSARSAADTALDARLDTAETEIDSLQAFQTLDTPQPGTLRMTLRAAAQSGWLLMGTTGLSRTTYANLFNALIADGVIDNSSGNGSTTFDLPSMAHRVPVGLGTDSDMDALGETGGAKTHTLTEAELPAHDHSMTHDHPSTSTSSNGAHTHTVPNPFDPGQVLENGLDGFSSRAYGSIHTGENGAHQHTLDVPNFAGDTGTTGSGTAMSLVQPYLVVNFEVKV